MLVLFLRRLKSQRARTVSEPSLGLPNSTFSSFIRIAPFLLSLQHLFRPALLSLNPLPPTPLLPLPYPFPQVLLKMLKNLKLVDCRTAINGKEVSGCTAIVSPGELLVCYGS